MTWKHAAMAIVSTMAVALTLGCGSKSGPTRASVPPSGPAAASPTSSNVAGSWQGWVGVGARTTTVTLNLTQEGPALKGDLAVGGRPDLSGTVTGRVEGDTLRLRLEDGAVGPEVRVQGDTMTGIISGEPLNARRMR
jgi:hypothetical protein